MHGRVTNLSETHIHIQNENGIFEIKCKPQGARIGDIVDIENDHLKVLTRQHSRASKLSQRILDPRRRKAMNVRSQTEAGIRDFFKSKGFVETRTPLLVKSPGMEAHIDPFQTNKGQFLPSSPEFAMKKLLAGGLEKIFQICSAFRDEPSSNHHRPEFTMLEFYRAYSNYEQIMIDVEDLVEQLAAVINPQLKVQTPWPRLTVNDLFIEHAGLNLYDAKGVDEIRAHAERLGINTATDDTWDDIYFRIWIARVEPKLPQDRAVFVTHYPASQAALATLTASGWAERFEAYIGGIELCNGFNELTDATEQRARFEGEVKAREGKTPTGPIDEQFLAALEEGMPPAGGVALGIDRLVMLLANESDIEYCFWLNPAAN